jgi:hypothetical protein
MQTANHSVDNPNTITVRVPIVFRHRGGRKTVTTPDGSPVSAPTGYRVDNALVRAIARAFRWRKLVEAGVHQTIQGIADAEKVNPSYVGRVLRLTLLAPDIVEAILNGRQPTDVTLVALVKPFAVEWTKQSRRRVT